MYKSIVINLNSKIESQNPEADLVSTLKNIWVLTFGTILENWRIDWDSLDWGSR